MTGLRRRALGRSGIEAAELGLGAMDTPTSREGPATLRRALDLGIDFVDTARDYAGSEFLIGQAVRERAAARASADAGFRISSKTFSRTIDGSQRDVDRSLGILGVERIDLYQLHDVSSADAWEEATGEHGALEGLRIARARGLIGHIGISSHSTEVIGWAVRSGEFAAVMLEYSAFFPATEGLIALAHERGVGVIVMRPLGGSGRASVMRGRIAEGYDGPLTPANLLRYALTPPGVSVVVPGARLPSRIDANAAAASAYEPMDAAERRALEAEAERLY